MLIMKKTIMYVTLFIILLLAGCIHKDFEQKKYINDNSDKDQFSKVSDDLNDKWYLYGTKIKQMHQTPGMDDIAIDVNGEVITKKQVETIKIYCELFEDAPSVQEKLNDLIRETVVISEAKHLKLEPNQKEIDEYMGFILENFDADSDAWITICRYIEGLEITIEEYLNILETEEYADRLRVMWWETVKRPYEEDMISEADRRNENLSVIDAEYYEKYVDELMDKAIIEYFDNEVEKLLTN